MLVDAQDILKVRPVDPPSPRRLDAAIDALSTRSAQNARSLQLLGDAHGKVTFGYIAETPIWRTTYRLVVAPPGKDSAQLQGWALVHNDTDERWNGIHLELVNGEPDSFLFPLAAPRYARRTLVHPETPLSTMAQLQGTTPDALWGDHLDAATSGSGQRPGFGSGYGRLGGSHRSHAPSVRMGATQVNEVGASSVLSVGNLADLAPAQGVENGALFVFAMPGAFVLDAHSSALVPIMDKPVKTENIAFFASAGGTARAAVRFVNSTGQTLPAGTLAVFGAGGFAGETALDRLKPGDRRFLQVGNDLDAEVTSKTSDRTEESKRLTFRNGRLEEHFLATTKQTWELENRGGAARTFYVALTAEKNATVTGTDRVDFDEATSRPSSCSMRPRRANRSARSSSPRGSRARTRSMCSAASKCATPRKTTIPAAELAILAQAEPRIARSRPSTRRPPRPTRSRPRRSRTSSVCASTEGARRRREGRRRRRRHGGGSAGEASPRGRGPPPVRAQDQGGHGQGAREEARRVHESLSKLGAR